MAAMRIFWLVLLMVLLPLRGWIGDVMATGMAGKQLQRAAHAALADPQMTDMDHAHHGQTVQASPDCAGHEVQAGGHPEGSCESCSACQACHSLALLVPATPLIPLPAERMRALNRADRFASADASPGQKPPIS